MNAARTQKTALSTSDVARLLGVAVSSVAKWIDDGQLYAGRTPGGHRRIEKEDLVKFLKQQGLRVPAELDASPRSILIVDDERSFASWLAEELAEALPDFEIKQAYDGYEAGRSVALRKPDLILLDISLPGMDGYELCQRIKSTSDTSDVVVIAITGNALAEVESRIMSAGASACLGKPVELPVLLAEITRSLALRR